MLLFKRSEDATSETIGWEPVANATGYRFTTNGQRSHTWDPNRDRVRIAKGAQLTVEALGVLDAGEWPQPTPALGAELAAKRPRLPASPGAVIEVATVSELKTALASGPMGGTIDCKGRTFDPGSSLAFEWRRQGSSSAPTTIRNLNIINGFFQVTGGGRGVRLQDVSSVGSPHFGFRQEGGDHVELVRYRAELSKQSGYLFSIGAVGYQVWDSVSKDVGLGDTLSHGMYVESADDRCVIANHKIDGWEGFGYHLYTGRSGFPTRDLVLTCITSMRGRSYAASVLDVDTGVGAVPWRGVKIIGFVSTSAPGGIAWCKDSTLADGNRLAGACEWPKGTRPDANYQIDRLAPVAHILADPKLDVNGRPGAGSPVKALVPVEYHGWVPARDADGKSRLTADAGAYAALS